MVYDVDIMVLLGMYYVEHNNCIYIDNQQEKSPIVTPRR